MDFVHNSEDQLVFDLVFEIVSVFHCVPQLCSSSFALIQFIHISLDF